MKNLLALSISVLLGFVACSPKSEQLATQKPIEEEKVEIPQYEKVPQIKYEWVTEDGGQSQLEFNPRVDILFVTDNSDSMKSAQQNLKRNIGKFTAGILKNRMIDYHIGVISTWDRSERALKAKKDIYEIGDLRHIKDLSGKEFKERFLTRTNGSDIIASSIDIGITPYQLGGPENEEFFAPLTAALEKNGPGAINDGFFRDDAQLVIILMTDADEPEVVAGGMSPKEMANTLFRFKNDNAEKVSVYGVLVRAEDKDEYKDYGLKIHPDYHGECFDVVGKKKVNNGKCKPFGPKNLEEFVFWANSKHSNPKTIKENFLMRITNPDFGTDLARIGNDITIKTLEKKIYLQQKPRVNNELNQLSVRVRYGSPAELQKMGGQVIPPGENGWLYNPKDNSIHLSGRIQYQYAEGAQFAVDLIPVNLKR